MVARRRPRPSRRLLRSLLRVRDELFAHSYPQPRCPKIAEPTRTWVAPNWIAVAKSALMPIDNCLRPLRAAILAVRAKCGAGASSTGGMHISPDIGKLYLSRHAAMNASASAGLIPAF